ncbi:VOC family protein [Actinoplanes sp. CA-030573]|uniref:VOC family protein n=1 Tax=Actinoplanes sp. CA-030573 TaxID=3239898 RepID=UPI003D8C5FAE
MTSFISHTTVDCADAYTLSKWWEGVLDYTEDPEDPNLPGHEECVIMSRDRSHKILFIEVPDAKQAKNRMHFDLRPAAGTRDEELARLIDHGAKPIDDLRKPDGGGWMVLADPEGNEFCILRSLDELAAATA